MSGDNFDKCQHLFGFCWTPKLEGVITVFLAKSKHFLDQPGIPDADIADQKSIADHRWMENTLADQKLQNVFFSFCGAGGLLNLPHLGSKKFNQYYRMYWN